MNLKSVIIDLSVWDVEEILRIDLEDDPAQALEFVKQDPAKRVRESLQTPLSAGLCGQLRPQENSFLTSWIRLR